MGREAFVHFTFLVAVFVFVTIFRGWFSPDYWAFWLGGVLGTVLPNVDHLIYVLTRGQELTPMRVEADLGKRKIWHALSVLAMTREERTGMIFHSFDFQVFFVGVALWVVTSSGSVLGIGLVLAFLLHLVVDQLVDFMETGGLERWNGSIIKVSRERQMWWWVGMMVVVLFIGFVL